MMSDILIFHADDGDAWASFLINKLVSPYYELPIRKSLFNTEDFEFSAECKVQVLLLTPDLLETASQKATNFLGLIPSRCVVVLLGVDREDIQVCLRAGGQCDHIFACKVCCVNSDNATVTKTLVTIIETFEGFDADDDLYAVPPTPRQVNQVYQIIPHHAVHGENIYILLDHKSDTEIKVHCDNIDEGIVSDCLDKAVYSLKLPENLKGEVNLEVVTDDQSIGEGRVTVESKLDRMRLLLEDVTDPTQLLCQAFGLQTYCNESLDKALLHRLKTKSSPSLFQSLLSVDDVNADEKGQTTWPTVLHFAAQYNLIHFTEELLKYPAMVLAACTENIDGDYPSTMAENKGHTELAKLLVDFVLENKNGFDSGILDPFSMDLPPPEPHLFKSRKYVNQFLFDKTTIQEDDDSDYIDMNSTNYFCRQQSVASSSPTSSFMNRHLKSQLFGSHRSASEGDTGRYSFLKRDVSPHNRELPRAPHLPNKTYSQSLDSPAEDDDDDAIYSTPSPASPLIHHRMRLDVLSDTSSQRSSIISTSSTSSVKVEITEAAPTPTLSSADVSFDETDHIKPQKYLSVGNASSTTSSKEDLRSDKPIRRNRSVQSKISSFLRKLKPNFNSTSSDLPKIDRAGKKTKVYGKVGSNNNNNGDDSTQGSSVLSKVTSDKSPSPPTRCVSETERDSGSFSEEEDDKVKSLNETVSKREQKKGKKNDKKDGLSRKKSVRVIRALADGTTDAPIVPIKPYPDPL